MDETIGACTVGEGERSREGEGGCGGGWNVV